MKLKGETGTLGDYEATLACLRKDGADFPKDLEESLREEDLRVDKLIREAKVAMVNAPDGPGPCPVKVIGSWASVIGSAAAGLFSSITDDSASDTPLPDLKALLAKEGD